MRASKAVSPTGGSVPSAVDGAAGGAADITVDVAVIGEHPSACFAAALLAQGGRLRVLHVLPPPAAPGKPADRLVWINPALFHLSPLLATLCDTLRPFSTFGLQFLSGDPAVRSSYRTKTPAAQIASYAAVRKAMVAIAKVAGVRCVAPRQLSVQSVDENGVLLRTGKTTARAKLLVMSDGCPAGQAAMLGLHAGWSADVLLRYTIARCPRSLLRPTGDLPVIHVSPNLDGSHHFGWLLPGESDFQLMVEQPAASATSFPSGDARPLMRRWTHQLQAAGILSSAAAGEVAGEAEGDAAVDSLSEITLPAGGALVEEAVGNRTLLIGPAGGFVSACGEEIYPGCWSALFADKVARKALRDRHPQDALQPYRHTWRTTLGQYLRGPRENLPLLLSLVYKNAALTHRLAEAILNGKPVVR